jgi:hypothetical protein
LIFRSKLGDALHFEMNNMDSKDLSENSLPTFGSDDHQDCSSSQPKRRVDCFSLKLARRCHSQFDFEIQPVLAAFGVLCFSKLITPRISHDVAQETHRRDEVQRSSRIIAGKLTPTSAQGDYGGQHSSVMLRD